MQIFPNPSADQVTVLFNTGNNEHADLKISDPQGRIVFEKTVSGTSSMIDVSTFAKGIYTVEISSNDAVAKKKLVVE